QWSSDDDNAMMFHELAFTHSDVELIHQGLALRRANGRSAPAADTGAVDSILRRAVIPKRGGRYLPAWDVRTHSCRNASNGRTASARCAGTRAATAPISVSTSVVTTKTNRSSPCAPN